MSNSLSVKENSAYLITDEFDRRYHSGIICSEGYVVVTAKETTYFADARYFYALREKLKNAKVKAKLFKGFGSIKEYLIDSGIKTLYVDYNATTLTQYETYKEFGVEVVNGAKKIADCRKAKTQCEIDNIARACQIAKDAFDYILPFIKEGVTERSIKNRLEKFMKKNGAEGPSFETIVAFGKNSAVPHHETGDTKLKKNQTVLMDYGCVVNGYCSDITRTVFYGEPTKEFEQVFLKVAGANLLALDRAVDGVKTKDLDELVREYFSSLGVEDKFTHSLGHGVGLQIHEEPYLSKKGDGLLKENYVFTIEPGLYLDGEFGVRIENTVVIKDGDAVSLTGNGRELIVIK